MGLINLMLSILVFLCLGYVVIFVMMYKYGSKTINVNKHFNYEPYISVVIPTMNEENIIEKRIHNILQMDYSKENLEIIFIDNSNDKTYNIIEKYVENYPFIKLIKQNKHGFNNALNEGYSYANGEIIIKSDVTAFPFKDALKNLVSNFYDEAVGAVTGVHLFEDYESVEKEFKGIMYKIQNIESYFHSSLISHGSFGGYRKELIPKLGEEITADDSEVVVNVVRNGYRAIIDETVISKEEEPISFIERRKQKNRRAAGVIKVILSNLDMMFNRKYGAFGYITLPIEFFILILTPILLFIMFILSLIYIMTNLSLKITILSLAMLGLIFFSLKYSVTLRAVLDTYLSCFFGLFQAFTKKKTWK